MAYGAAQRIVFVVGLGARDVVTAQNIVVSVLVVGLPGKEVDLAQKSFLLVSIMMLSRSITTYLDS